MENPMLNKTLIWLIPVLIAGLLLQACSQENGQLESPNIDPPATSTSAAEPSIQGYPAPDLEIDPGGSYPGPNDSDFVDPTNRPELPAILPTPEEGKAVVSGTILYAETGMAPPEAAVYLGGMVTTDTGIRIVQLNRDDAPVAVPATDGRFLFSAVEPGEYGLILFHPDISFIVDDPDTGYSVVFTVEPGQSIELDEVTINLP